MKIKPQLIDELFVKLDQNEFTVLMKLIGQLDNKTDVLTIKDEALEALIKGSNDKGLGRDVATRSLSFLAENGYISKKQQIDSSGKFGTNAIKITTDLIT
jgi:hypothetical protein